MGRIRHSAIVVTGSEMSDAVAAHKVAADLGLIVTPVVPGTNNGYASFLICPDGSKESWDTSIANDKARYEWVKWAGQPYPDKPYIDWVYVDFGGDDDFVLVRDYAENDDRKPQTYFS